jgi:hypothetical protein
VCVTGNIGNLLSLYPLSFLRDRSCTVVHSLMNRAHVLDFCRIDHIILLLILDGIEITLKIYHIGKLLSRCDNNNYILLIKGLNS